MKKVFSIILVFALMLTTFAGCAAPATSGNGNSQTGSVAAPSSLNRLLMVTGGTSGTYFAYGGVIATTLTDKLTNIEITANTSGASAANARSLKNEEAELAVIQNDVLDYAYNGTELLADDGAMPMLRTIATLYPEVIQIVATKSSGIKTVADMKGKKMCVGDAGSGTEANARQVLAAYGLTYADLNAIYLSFGEAATAMQNGEIDASFTTAGVPNAAITELNTATEIVIVPVNGAEANKLLADYPFYSTFKITDDAYGIPGADTVAILATMACTESLPFEVAYWITRGLFENQAELASGHAKGELLSAESAVQGASVPFHPGAEAYYKEIGVLK